MKLEWIGKQFEEQTSEWLRSGTEQRMLLYFRNKNIWSDDKIS